MRTGVRSFWLMSLVLIGWNGARSQSNPPAAEAGEAQEAAVIQRTSTRVVFQVDGSGWRENTAEIKIQSEAGVQQMGVIRFSYAKDNESVEIGYVRVRKADGTVVVTPPENVQDMPSDVTRVAPVYSDLREKHVAVKGLGVGDVLEYSVKSVVTNPEVPGQFWFEYNFVKDGIARDEELEISVPRDKYVKLASPQFPPKIDEQNGARIYRWKTANLERKPEPKKNPAELASTPAPDVQLTTFHSWEEVGRWYYDLQRDRVAATPEIQSKAAELTKGLSGDAEKIHAIYNYVATRNRYVGLSFGIGRYQPHFAAEVLSNEYGDCKDKHTLLAALLKAAGYEAWPALISSTRKLDPEFPSPAQFDHVISVLPQGAKLTWLDTTPGVAPFGLLIPTLRDKLALLIPSGKAAELMKTPADPPFPFAIRFDAEGKIDSGGTFTGHMQRSSRGDEEVAFRTAFRMVPRARWQELVQGISAGTGFGGTVSSVEGSNPEDTEGPFHYSYDYTRKDYGGWTDHQITPPLPIFGIEVLANQDDKPTGPIFVGAPGEAVYHARVELPVDTVKLPSDSNVKQDFAEYHSTYSKEGNTLVAERRLLIREHEIPASRWEDYKKLAKAISDDENQWVELEAPRAERGKLDDAGRPATAAEPPSQAQRLVEQARQADERHDDTTVAALLEQLIAVDPKYPGAWGMLGALHVRQNQPDKGLEEIKKEIENHPDDLPVYKALAYYQTRLRRTGDAIQTWRSLLKVAPEDGDAVKGLEQLLMAEKRYPELIELLEPRIAKLAIPEEEISLGTAYLESGQKDKGVAELEKAVQQDSGPRTLNSAAYMLADANVELLKAQEWATRAVSILEKESQDVFLSTLKSEDLGRMSSLAALWDTLGWVYFREGDEQAAEKYLDAAWVLVERPIVGDHLGQVYQQEGKAKAAAHAYELALAARADFEDARKHLAALTAKNPALATPSQRALLKGGGGPGHPALAMISTAAGELSAIRTVKLPRLTSKTASAEYFLLFSAGPKLEEVKFISGAAELSKADKALSAAHYNLPIPDEQARIVRRGILMCSQTTAECSIVLLPPASVQSVN